MRGVYAVLLRHQSTQWLCCTIIHKVHCSRIPLLSLPQHRPTQGRPESPHAPVTWRFPQLSATAEPRRTLVQPDTVTGQHKFGTFKYHQMTPLVSCLFGRRDSVKCEAARRAVAIARRRRDEAKVRALQQLQDGRSTARRPPLGSFTWAHLQQVRANVQRWEARCTRAEIVLAECLETRKRHQDDCVRAPQHVSRPL